jgi:hypothetical protein
MGEPFHNRCADVMKTQRDHGIMNAACFQKKTEGAPVHETTNKARTSFRFVCCPCIPSGQLASGR